MEHVLTQYAAPWESYSYQLFSCYAIILFSCQRREWYGGFYSQRVTSAISKALTRLDTSRPCQFMAPMPVCKSDFSKRQPGFKKADQDLRWKGRSFAAYARCDRQLAEARICFTGFCLLLALSQESTRSQCLVCVRRNKLLMAGARGWLLSAGAAARYCRLAHLPITSCQKPPYAAWNWLCRLCAGLKVSIMLAAA